MSDVELNALVEKGKEDVLQFMKHNLFPEEFRDGNSSSLSSMYFLSVKKESAGLDILRTRAMIVQENEEFLAQINSNDQEIVFAMARAAGRVSQMKECIAAVDRILLTCHEADEERIEQALGLKQFLHSVEKIAVRLGHTTDGRFGLMPLSAVFEATHKHAMIGTTIH